MATSGLGTVAGENKALDALLGSSDPVTVYLAAYSAAPTKAGGGTEEANMPRLAITNGATQWPAAAAGLKSNGEEENQGPATGACAQTTHFGIHNHITNDALICWGPLTTPRTAASGDYLRYAIGDIDITLDNEA